MWIEEEEMFHRPNSSNCTGTRREFLWEAGAGFAGLALASLLDGDGFFARHGFAGEATTGGYVRPLAPKPAHFEPAAQIGHGRLLLLNQRNHGGQCNASRRVGNRQRWPLRHIKAVPFVRLTFGDGGHAWRVNADDGSRIFEIFWRTERGSAARH